MVNINSKKYWEERFSNGDWENKGGNWQTRSFAKTQIKFFNIDRKFDGTILDFGCGLGDAFPIYKTAFPYAKLVGVDISQSAINKCVNKYSNIASFIAGDYTDIPSNIDIIISSNVFEHLTNDKLIAKELIKKSKKLFVIVPYKEDPLCEEHINSYDEHYFEDLGNYSYNIYTSLGWPPYSRMKIYYNYYLKNILRFFLKKSLVKKGKQIMYTFIND